MKCEAQTNSKLNTETQTKEKSNILECNLENAKDKSKENIEKEAKEKNMKEDKNYEIKKEQEVLKLKLEETEDRLKRVAAEFDNYKKRSSKEKEEMYSSIMGEVVSNFLPVIDNLEKAAMGQTEDENYKQGVELVLKQFKDVLTSNGIKEIDTVGKTFDPELHEAVSLVTDENLGEKEIKEEYRKGYMIGNKVIRHSMVVVAN